MTDLTKAKRIVADPILFIEAFMKVQAKDLSIMPFKLTDCQKHFLLNMQIGGNAILKSRQMGFSTIINAYMIWKCIVFPGTECLQMAQNADTANTLFLKLKRLYNLMLEDAKIPTIANSRKEIIFTNGSRITVAACTHNDRGRGSTLNFVHLSEVAKFPDEYLEQNLVALRSALVSDGIIVAESTSNGLNGWCSLFCDAVKEWKDYIDRKKDDKTLRFAGSWKPFFYSFLNSGLHNAEIDKYAENYKNMHKSLTTKQLDEEEIILKEKGATLKLLMWRRMKIQELGGITMFHQEFPSTFMESFISSGNSVFNPEQILANIDTAKKKELKPIKNDMPELMRRYSREIKLWRYAEKGKKYFISVDGAAGLGGGDNTVFVILDETCQQVAEFASNRIKPYESAELLLQICKYYNGGLLIIENASSGQFLLPKFKNDYQYYNLYRQKKFNGKKSSDGFNTTNATKSVLITNLQEAFESDLICINSIDTLNEMKSFQEKENGSFGGVGSHDDRVMALALALEAYTSGMNGRYYG